MCTIRDKLEKKEVKVEMKLVTIIMYCKINFGKQYCQKQKMRRLRNENLQVKMKKKNFRTENPFARSLTRTTEYIYI